MCNSFKLNGRRYFLLFFFFLFFVNLFSENKPFGQSQPIASSNQNYHVFYEPGISMVTTQSETRDWTIYFDPDPLIHADNIPNYLSFFFVDDVLSKRWCVESLKFKPKIMNVEVTFGSGKNIFNFTDKDGLRCIPFSSTTVKSMHIDLIENQQEYLESKLAELERKGERVDIDDLDQLVEVNLVVRYTNKVVASIIIWILSAIASFKLTKYLVKLAQECLIFVTENL